MKRILLYILMIAFSSTLWAEAIGTWRLYPSYSDVMNVEPAGKDIFVLASGNLYSYNVADNSLTTYDKTTCLNGSDISFIAWAQAAKRLVITYADSSIDILSLRQDVQNISDISEKQMSGSKIINDIYIYGKYAYISTGFGIVRVDVENALILDSYNLGYNVNYCYIEGEYIYAQAKYEGFMRAALTDNLYDKANWHRLAGYTPKETETYFEDNHNNCYWGSDEAGNLVKYKKTDDGTMEAVSGFSPLKPDGPACSSSFRLTYFNNALYVGAGGWSHLINGFGQVAHAMVLKNDEWTEFENTGAVNDATGGRYSDVNRIVVDPRDDKHAFVTSYRGFYEFYDGKFVKRYGTADGLHTYDESEKEHRVITTDTFFDKVGNMWFANSLTPHPLWTIDVSGNLKNLAQDVELDRETTAYDIEGFCLDNETLWFVNSRENYSALYRYDTTTDELKYATSFTDQDGNALTPKFFTAAVDKKGNVWVGSDAGPLYLKPEDKESWTFTKHKVPRNDGTNLADYLLDNIGITAIAVDSQNRKWLGTRSSGVFLVSDDCNTQVYHFAADDSPLLSDCIFDIEIDDETGRVYFATQAGLCSFLADVTSGNEDEMSDDKVWVYPNPVTPEHTGMITVVGLITGAQISIVSSSGQLVHQGTCYGGSYQWNGKDLQGRDVASGVYMVYIATNTGTSGPVTKIAIVR